eukprot:6173933-Pleurochrysis_carterae.AAC.3
MSPLPVGFAEQNVHPHWQLIDVDARLLPAAWPVSVGSHCAIDAPRLVGARYAVSAHAPAAVAEAIARAVSVGVGRLTVGAAEAVGAAAACAAAALAC